MQQDNAWDRLNGGVFAVELPPTFAYCDVEGLLAVVRFTMKRQKEVLS